TDCLFLRHAEEACPAGEINVSGQIRVIGIGLDPDAVYKERFTGATYRGDQLMNFGLHAPTTLEFHSILWILEKIN
ncbi:MAG: GH36 C-terminal domain-containing protein, partial [Clostridia bacterium]|nr:GH36 C-terminal domain-containing protein [Clostridia bacterium]